MNYLAIVFFPTYLLKEVLLFLGLSLDNTTYVSIILGFPLSILFYLYLINLFVKLRKEPDA